MRRPLTATALALFLTLPALGEKVDLRGPAPKAGEVTVSTVESKMEAGNLNMTMQGQNLPGQMEMSSNHVVETTLVEVAEGEATKVQHKFEKASTKTKMTIFGQQQEQEDDSMEGATMTQTKTDDGWESTIEGVVLPPQAKDMIKEAGYVDQRNVFPEKPVAVGDKWKAENEMLQTFMGQSALPGAKVEGEIAFELVEIKEVDGNKIAVIDYTMDGKVTMDMSPDPNTQMDLVIEMDGKGQLERNVSNYTTNQTFEGEMKMTNEVKSGGQQVMSMTGKMPMTTKTTQTRK